MTRADRERAQQIDHLAEQLVASGALQSDPRYALTNDQRRYALEQAVGHLSEGEPLTRVVALALIDAEAELSREYSDNVHFGAEVSQVYDHVTNGLLSKPTYEASVVIQAHEDRCHESCQKDYAELEEQLDDLADAAARVLKYFAGAVCPEGLVEVVEALRTAHGKVPA